MSIEYVDQAHIHAEAGSAAPQRSLTRAMWHGFLCRCPACGTGRLYERYLKVSPVCTSCGQELHHHRADDAPPYFTMFIVGHLLVPAVLVVEKLWAPEIWIHMVLWLSLTVVLTLSLLPRVKGAIVGLQWALHMHGFDLAASDEDTTADLSRHL